MIGNTIRVKTFHDLFNTVGYLDFFLLDDFEIFNNDQGGSRGYQCYLVDLVRFEEFIADLDNPLFTHFLAIQVGAEEDLICYLRQV